MKRPKHLDVPVEHFNCGGLCRRYIDEYDFYYSDLISEAHGRITRAFYAMLVREVEAHLNGNTRSKVH